MKNSNYYKSEAHTVSVNNASKIAINTKYSCIDCKNIYPISNLNNHACKSCPVCSNIVIGSVRKFCSKSCAAKYNNNKRTPQMRQKQGQTLRKKFKDNPELLIKFHSAPQPIKKFCRVSFINCNHCKEFFLVKNWENAKNQNKYCSDDCRTKSRMNKQTNHHGHKKIYKYFNNYLNKIISLESSWEFKIAQFLDELQVIWIRPEPISWIDEKLKSHLYYADFYLPNYDIYLDPKNPYVMQLDTYKMSIIEQKVKIIYGSIKHVKENISNLLHIGQGAGS